VNKRWLYFIILLICVSLAGIIAVQYLWISNAFTIREAQFRQGVNDAMSQVVSKLETSENMQLLRSRLVSDSIMTAIKKLAYDTTALTESQRNFDQIRKALRGKKVEKRKTYPPVTYHSQQVVIPVNNEYHSFFTWSVNQQHSLDSIMELVEANLAINEEIYSFELEWQAAELEKLDSIRIVHESYLSREPVRLNHRSETPRVYRDASAEKKTANAQQKARVVSKPASVNHITKDIVVEQEDEDLVILMPPSPEAQQEATMMLEDNVVKLNNRTRQIQDLIKRMILEYEEKPRNISSRINRETLENFLSASLSDHNISIPFEFAVYNPENDSNNCPIRSDGFTEISIHHSHHISLFPNDVITKPDQLMVFFPGEQTHIFKSLSLLMLGSLLFTLIIMVTSGMSIVVMLRQKRISDIKTDFINNMTHEFKTPIATISIAADSINNPKVIEQPDQIKAFTRIIKEENSRMNTSVEQVLQMSLLDSRDFRLHTQPVDIHDLITRTVDNFRLIVGKREGIIITELNAGASCVALDEDHMRNVLMNLLDNANKYSPSSPEITVTTQNRSGRLVLSISDKGTGMSQEVQKRIFDKFYRVTTGNVHNVKGFGLGLSYVKAIILAHKGEITVTSEPGIGSRFDIILPLCEEPGFNE